MLILMAQGFILLVGPIVYSSIISGLCLFWNVSCWQSLHRLGRLFCLFAVTITAFRTVAQVLHIGLTRLGFHEWEMALRFLEPHQQEADDHDNPIHVVRDDGAVGCRVLPTEEGVEDTPSSAAVQLWVTILGCISYGAGIFNDLLLTLTCQTLLSMS